MEFRNDKDFEEQRKKALDKRSKKSKSKTNSKNLKIFLLFGVLVLIALSSFLYLYFLNKDKGTIEEKKIVNETLYNEDMANWLELSPKKISEMKKEDLKYMIMEINLLSKIERLERENGFLTNKNPMNGEKISEYIKRTEENKDELSIIGLYHSMYEGREKCNEWMFEYIKENFPSMINGEYNFTEFCKNYSENYFRLQKNRFDLNKDLYKECEGYLLSIEKEETGFYRLPFKQTFINHLEDYTRFLPKNATTKDDQESKNFRFKIEKVTYVFAQDKADGSVYYYKVQEGDSSYKDKINFSNRWEMQNFKFIQEEVEDSKINIEEMKEKGYKWVEITNEKSFKRDLKKALIKENRLENKKHIILITERDEG